MLQILADSLLFCSVNRLQLYPVREGRINSEGSVARGVFSSGDFSLPPGKRSRVKHRAFFKNRRENAGHLKLSVDQWQPGEIPELVRLGEERAEKRSEATGEQRTFYGWGLVTREDAERSGRRVVDTSCSANRLLAEIRLPTSAEERATRIHHAQDLGRLSRWEPKPS